MAEKISNLNARIPANLHRRLKNRAKWDGVKIERLVRDALESHLTADGKRMLWIIGQVVDSLPSTRDWLDPSLEREMRKITIEAARDK